MVKIEGGVGELLLANEFGTGVEGGVGADLVLVDAGEDGDVVVGKIPSGPVVVGGEPGVGDGFGGADLV